MKVCIVGSGSWGTALAIKSVVPEMIQPYIADVQSLRMNLLSTGKISHI